MDNEQQWQNKKGHSLFLIEKFMGVLFFLFFGCPILSLFLRQPRKWVYPLHPFFFTNDVASNSIPQSALSWINTNLEPSKSVD